MAAGLSIAKKDYERFSIRFKEVVAQHINARDLKKVVCSDGPVAAQEMVIEAAEVLQFAGPWGQNFQEPIFDDVFEVINWKIIGENHLKLQLKLLQSETVVDAIAFNTDETVLPMTSGRIRASYRMSVNEYRNNRTLQLIIVCIDSA